jgi:hypothetical protein
MRAQPQRPSYLISPAKSAGFIAMNNVMMRPMATPISVPAATPRASIFFRRLSCHTSKGYCRLLTIVSPDALATVSD